MPFTPAIYTLGYILSPDRQSVLMIERFSGPDRAAIGRFNGLGGKLEPDEDVASGMRREIQEEAGIDVIGMTLRGTVSWPGASTNGGGRFGFVFLITGWTGTPLTENEEGLLHWLPLADVLSGKAPQWPGREKWIGLVFDADPRPFHGIEPHDHGALVPDGWRHTRV